MEPSPAKIARRLRLLDQRPISNAVDADQLCRGNGKRTHVFDMDSLEGGKLVIRKAKIVRNEDARWRRAHAYFRRSVAADAKKPVGLAGVMAGSTR